MWVCELQEETIERERTLNRPAGKVICLTFFASSFLLLRSSLSFYLLCCSLWPSDLFALTIFGHVLKPWKTLFRKTLGCL